jgi:hypothetical protein
LSSVFDTNSVMSLADLPANWLARTLPEPCFPIGVPWARMTIGSLDAFDRSVSFFVTSG